MLCRTYLVPTSIHGSGSVKAQQTGLKEPGPSVRKGGEGGRDGERGSEGGRERGVRDGEGEEGNLRVRDNDRRRRKRE